MSDPGRVAAVDYGRRRVGLAVSDALRITTRGLPTLERAAAMDEAAAQVAQVLLREQVREVVLGLPLHADGRESEMSAEVRRFAALLEARLAPAGVRLHLHDEGLSSWEAEEGLKAGGRDMAKARREGAIDQRAALGLLRGWLEGQP
ncbi:MAG: Holliday junction resolvase RuvX [Planctomycetia bacterium]